MTLSKEQVTNILDKLDYATQQNNQFVNHKVSESGNNCFNFFEGYEEIFSLVVNGDFVNAYVRNKYKTKHLSYYRTLIKERL